MYVCIVCTYIGMYSCERPHKSGRSILQHFHYSMHVSLYLVHMYIRRSFIAGKVSNIKAVQYCWHYTDLTDGCLSLV